MNTKLLEQLAATENLLLAWRSVRGNIPKYRRARSAGSDGVSLAEFEQHLNIQITSLRDTLLEERYAPSAPTCFDLPKRNGGKRTISVLNVRDRIAQRAAQQVLEPLWEPVFLDCSFGYRPGLSIQMATECVRTLRSHGNSWVVDGDIAACFDSLDHDLLIAGLKHKVADSRVLRLFQVWLDAGVMKGSLPHEIEPALGRNGNGSPAMLQRSLDWAMDALVESENPYHADPYELARYEQPEGELTTPDRDALVSDLRRRSVKRMVASGLLLSASWAKPALAVAGKVAKTTLATPAGRRLLKNGAMATGGLAGVAAAAALTAFLMHRRAGPSPTGILQGSPLSPLLANIYLHPFDAAMRKNGHNLVRFADDWVILCPTQEAAEAAYNDAVRSLARLHLKVNPEKTHILAPKDRLEWLGMVISG